MICASSLESLAADPYRTHPNAESLPFHTQPEATHQLTILRFARAVCYQCAGCIFSAVSFLATQHHNFNMSRSILLLAATAVIATSTRAQSDWKQGTPPATAYGCLCTALQPRHRPVGQMPDAIHSLRLRHLPASAVYARVRAARSCNTSILDGTTRSHSHSLFFARMSSILHSMSEPLAVTTGHL